MANILTPRYHCIQFAKAGILVIALPKMRAWMSCEEKEEKTSQSRWACYFLIRHLTLVPEQTRKCN